MLLIGNVRSWVKKVVDKVPLNWLYFELAKVMYLIGNRKRKGAKTRYHCLNDQLFKATDPSGKYLYFAERTRFRLYHYANGVDRRLAQINEKYTHDRVKVDNGDIVIDIGANIGEYSLAISRYAKLILAIDPDPNIQSALRENLKRLSNAKLFAVALSDSENEVDFFLSTKDADSSIVKPDEFSRTVKVKTMTLDQIVKEQGLDIIHFLKLEAEGWEPEILAGATKTLQIVKKIAVDAGPERLGETTVGAVCELLDKAGFQTIVRSDIVYGHR